MLKERIKKISGPRLPQKKSRVNRFVLMIGDEGAILLHIRGGKVESRQFSAEPQSPETKEFEETVRASPRTPLSIIFDTIDQAYVQQTLPPVTAMSINKLIKRRLDRDFSDDYLKAALRLGKEKDGRKDWLFMMVALQRTGIVKSWLDIVAEWPNRVAGMHMLPVEATRIMKKISNAEEESASGVWQFLISYNRVSGIRQIICKNGVLTLTRLGQPALESNAEAIAGTIEQEIIGTKEYLKRLGFDEKDRLVLTVIVADDIRKHIDLKKLRADAADIYTPHEIALRLGLENATQPGDRYGDVVLSAAIGGTGRPLLKLTTKEIAQFAYYYAALLGGKIFSLLLIFALLASSGYSAVSIFHLMNETRELKVQYEKKQKEINTLKEKSKSLTDDDLEEVVDTISIYEVMLSESFDPEPLLARVEAGLGKQIRVSDFDWMLDEKSAATPGKARMTLGMTLEFPLELANDREKLQQLTTDTLNNLKVSLPGYDISYQSIPSIINDREQIEANLTNAAPAKPVTEIAKSMQARLQMTGLVNPPELSSAPKTAGADVSGGAVMAPSSPANGKASDGAR